MCKFIKVTLGVTWTHLIYIYIYNCKRTIFQLTQINISYYVKVHFVLRFFLLFFTYFENEEKKLMIIIICKERKKIKNMWKIDILIKCSIK